jgi:hypothetical protein
VQKTGKQAWSSYLHASSSTTSKVAASAWPIDIAKECSTRETLHLATAGLPHIDTGAIASQESVSQLCTLLSVMLAMAVLSPKVS